MCFFFSFFTAILTAFEANEDPSQPTNASSSSSSSSSSSTISTTTASTAGRSGRGVRAAYVEMLLSRPRDSGVNVVTLEWFGHVIDWLGPLEHNALETLYFTLDQPWVE